MSGAYDDGTIAAVSPTLATGLAAARARIKGEFGLWTGGLSHPLLDGISERHEERLSATSLQRYAGCGFQYFLRHVLGVKAIEEPDETKADGRERGTQVHDVLEHLVEASLGRDPHAAWSDEDHAWAQEMLNERLDTMRAEGKAGRPQVWAVEVELRRRQLRRMLLADDAYRATRRARPVATEHKFGYSDDELATDPLLIETASGEVRLGGSIDRVDAIDGGGLVVMDYKTGRDDDYKMFPADGAARGNATDFVAAGTKLQLPLYALAAMRDLPAHTDDVSGYYVFVDDGGARRGGPLTEEDFDRFHSVTDVIAAGIREGSFPARPGDYDGYSGNFTNCRWCDYHRICSLARDDLWEGVRDDPRVTPYADIAEPREGATP
jgi:RecB family exonuclease